MKRSRIVLSDFLIVIQCKSRQFEKDLLPCVDDDNDDHDDD